MKKVFTEEHVGQKVHCAVYGNGQITSFHTHDTYPVIVEGLGWTNRFTVDGKNYRAHAHPTLSFGHREFTDFCYGEPEVVCKPLVLGPLILEDRPVEAYVSDISLENALNNKNRKLILGIGYYDPRGTSYFGVNIGSHFNSTSHVYTWEYAIAIPVEKVKELTDECI